MKNHALIRALVDVRTQITVMDRALNHAITLLMDEQESAPRASLDLGDGLPPQCVSGMCSDN